MSSPRAESIHPTGGLPLAEQLQTIARAACESIGCRYAALSVLGVDGQLEYFVTNGTHPDVPEQIGRLPTHQGLLGVVATDGITVRLGDIGVDSRSAGLPDHHPDIHTLLGVPIMLRGRSAGGVYLSGPTDRAEFSAVDEGAAALVAQDVAAAVERHRTEAENRRREKWHTGAAELARELVFGRDRDPMTLVAERVVEIADADVALVLQRGATPDTPPALVAAAGRHAARILRLGLRKPPALAIEVLATGKPVLASNVSQRLPADLRCEHDVESIVLVPFAGTTDIRFVLSVGRYPGGRPFTPAEMSMATMFAGQTALALELAETQVLRERLALIEERDRIARDLHDHVIQRLFATGMAMESASRTLVGEAADVVRANIDDIDESIKQIRNTIYQLSAPILPSDSTLRARAGRLFGELEPALGFRPRLTVDGPADYGLDDDVVEDSVAVLREALSNVARHARASRVDVAVVVTEDDVTLTIRDDGRGMGETSRRSGLANMRARAENRSGTLTVRSGAGDGTRLIWTVPLRRRA